MWTHQIKRNASHPLRTSIPWRRGISLVAMLLGVVGLNLCVGVKSAHASTMTTTDNTTSSISLTVFVPCAAGGAGEDVVLSGQLHDLIHVTLTDNGHFHIHSSDNPQGVSGVGLTTGTKYQGTGVSLFDTQLANFFSDDTPFNETSVNTFHLVGQGPGNNLLVRDTFHITLNPDLTITSSHDHFRITCA